MLIELISLVVTAEALRANIVSKSAISLYNGGRLTQNLRQKGLPSTNHSSSQKTRLNVLSCGVKVWTDCFSVLSQSTRLTDRQTDRQNSHC